MTINADGYSKDPFLKNRLTHTDPHPKIIVSKTFRMNLDGDKLCTNIVELNVVYNL
jgi:hypothetical protein